LNFERAKRRPMETEGRLKEEKEEKRKKPKR
jgi:hypothetical protein